MSDKNYFHAPEEDWSVDDLISDARQQIEAAPGELPFDEPLAPVEEPVFSAPEAFPEAEPIQEAEFIPDFGTAFDDYGEYEPQMTDDAYMPPISADPYASEDYPPEEYYDGPVYDDEEGPLPPQKPKRKRKRRIVPLPVKVVLYLVIVAVAAVGLGYGIWECAKDVLAFGRSEERLTVMISEGDTLDDIAQYLESEGVIKYPWLFKVYCGFTDSEGDVLTETVENCESYDFYTIYYNYDYHALTAGMSPNGYGRTTFLVDFPGVGGETGRRVRVSFSDNMLEEPDNKTGRKMSSKMETLSLLIRYDVCTVDELLALIKQEKQYTLEEIQGMLDEAELADADLLLARIDPEKTYTASQLRALVIEVGIVEPENFLSRLEDNSICPPEKLATLIDEIGLEDADLLLARLETDGLCSGEEIFSLMEREVDDSTVRLTIPEGMTAADIFDLMEEKGVCAAEELQACAAETEFDYWFLEGIPYGEATRLEGFLFPDTYDFYRDDDPERVLNKLLANFNRKFSDSAKRQLERLNEKLAERLRNAGFGEEEIAARQLSVYDLITIASMVERETAGASESGTIASVIYNRLCDPSNFPCLQIDATVVYALGGVTGPLTYEDTQVDSPYNTYKYPGLPVGPISNPGLSSISAALNPADTNYYYYALDTETGTHHFSSTYSEHADFLEGQDYG